ncbi:hypothetical protein SAMN06295905_0464 [Devosia lucknowensis]|uniref:Uncharacterized protein n=1 Tax=Devosia lucknowensis TaxID=1096929 RepID=A0A1Y6EEP8_9HYPH|nr:hypothetical protein [Devosia lucknowensis]SMQ61045.1 hypothetical protein SAMN06295905_0464 [Devosia lucknowensis]
MSPRIGLPLVIAILVAAMPPAVADHHGLVARLDLSAWVGEWQASDEQRIFITLPDKKGLRFDGAATYGATDPERVEIGAVNVGDFSVRVPSRWIGADNTIDIAVNADGAAVPRDEADDYDCTLSLQLDWDAQFIVVTDNGMCGGLNVTFTGRYEKRPSGETSLEGNAGLTSFAAERVAAGQRPVGALTDA